MAEYQGEYGHPYPRVDQYGNPVPPVDQYGNPVPREPAAASGMGGGTVDTSTGQVSGADAAVYPPHDGVGGVIAPGGVAYPGGGVPPGETALAYEGMVGSGGAQAQLQPTPTVEVVEEERTFGSSQLQPSREEHTTTTLGEKLRGSGGSSSPSSSSEDDGQGGRRKKKSIKEKIKEKLPGTHKHEERQKAGGGHAAPGTAHEKKGFVEKIKQKLPGHH